MSRNNAILILWENSELGNWHSDDLSMDAMEIILDDSYHNLERELYEIMTE